MKWGIIICVFLFIPFCDNNRRYLKRQLDSSSSTDSEECSNIKIDLSTIEKYNTLDSYILTIKGGNEKQQNFIQNLLLTQELKGIKDFLLTFLPYLILIGFGIAFLICKLYL